MDILPVLMLMLPKCNDSPPVWTFVIYIWQEYVKIYKNDYERSLIYSSPFTLTWKRAGFNSYNFNLLDTL